MITLNRNIGIRLRHKTYVLAQSFAADNHLTTGDFIKSLLLFNGDYLVGLKERRNEVFQTADELKIAGRILNIHAKQINSNMESRNHLSDDFYNDLFKIIDRAISAYRSLRFHDNKLLISNFTFEPSQNYKYKKRSKLKPRTWQFFKVNLSEFEYRLILKKVEHYRAEYPKITVNKLANLSLGIFQNQNGFDEKYISTAAKNIIRQLKYIMVNSTQIYNDVRQNAATTEIIIAQNIREKMRYYLDDFMTDPAIYSGRKFSYMYYAKQPIFDTDNEDNCHAKR